MRKILVLRGGALGDFIVTLPALALLRQRWPDARIELVGNATAGQLAQRRGLLDAVHSQHEARWAALFGSASRPELPEAFATWLAEFDLVLNYWPDEDGALRARFPCRAGQVFLTASALPIQETAPAAAAAHYCAPLAALGIVPGELIFRLLPVDEATGVPATASAMRSEAPGGAAPGIAVHPGSGSPRKNWPQENWVRLIQQLTAPVAVILGEAESDPWSTLLARGWPASPEPRDSRVNANGASAVARTSAPPSTALAPMPAPGIRPRLLLNAPLEVLVRELASCRLFLGHDSGISHLAAACGAPCVLLFGPTNPVVWAPPAPRVRVLQRGRALTAISVEDVLQAATTALGDQR